MPSLTITVMTNNRNIVYPSWLTGWWCCFIRWCYACSQTASLPKNSRMFETERIAEEYHCRRSVESTTATTILDHSIARQRGSCLWMYNHTELAYNVHFHFSCDINSDSFGTGPRLPWFVICHWQFVISWLPWLILTNRGDCLKMHVLVIQRVTLKWRSGNNITVNNFVNMPW